MIITVSISRGINSVYQPFTLRIPINNNTNNRIRTSVLQPKLRSPITNK